MAERQAALIAQWMNVGFIHGVMNTDNMTISGETIDYGPCAFMEAYDPAAVFSSIDHQGRYAFGNQPDIACWNLARLAETLLPLLSDDREKAIAMATEVIAEFPAHYRRLSAARSARQARASSKPTRKTTRPTPRWSTTGWRCSMPSTSISRSGGGGLPMRLAGDEAPLRALFADAHAPDAWLARWRARCASRERQRAAGQGKPQATERANAMRGVNPDRHRPQPSRRGGVDRRLRHTLISRPSSDCWRPSGSRTTRTA